MDNNLNLKDEEPETIEISEEYLRSRIHKIRGQEVLLDSDLAEIYGYDTKGFNRQVKNNIEKFDSDFMFELTGEEVEDLRCKNCTANISPKNRYNPHVFTEQGLYMLMTVLKGPLAVKQSKALIRTFKKMKDYILENQGLIGQREYLQLSMQVSQNLNNTIDLRRDLSEIEEQVANVVDKLSDIVYKSDLADVMTEFGESQLKRDFIILDGEPFKADQAFSEIYSKAKANIFIIDNYIGIKTLEHLIECKPGVKVTIFSDNVRNCLCADVYSDFCKEYPHLSIDLKRTCGKFHDRYIVLDFETALEKIYLCGASSKDAGGRISSITEWMTKDLIDPILKEMLKNPELILK